MAGSSVLRATPSQSSPRERHPRRLSSETNRARLIGAGRISPAWTPGLNGVNGSLRKSLNAADSSTMLDRGLRRCISSPI